MNNVQNTEAVILDHTFRREVVDPFIKYPENILHCHEQHLAVVRQHATAAVEVVYGRLVRRRMLQTLNITRLKLWGSYRDCEIFFEWNKKGDASTNRRILRIIVFAYHPQCFLQAWGREWASEQDRSMTIASKLSKVDVRADFYQAGWENTIDILPYAAYLQNQTFVEAAKSAILALGRGNRKPAHLTECSSRDYAPHVSARAPRPCESTAIEHPNRDQLEIDSNNENAFILKPARKNVWQSMVRAVDEVTQLPRVMACVCIDCQEEGKIGPKRLAVAIDRQPRWTKGSPAKYIERTAECWTCEKQRRMVPVDESIESVSSNHMAEFWNESSSLTENEQIKSLQSLRGATKIHRQQKIGKNFNRSKREYEQDSFLSDMMKRDKRRPAVEVKCSTCQQPATDDTDVQVEKETGKYIAVTRQTCLSAQCKRRARLFVPRDPSVEYVSYHALQMRLYRKQLT